MADPVISNKTERAYRMTPNDTFKRDGGKSLPPMNAALLIQIPPTKPNYLAS